MERLFNAVVLNRPGAKSTNPLNSPQYMMLQAQPNVLDAVLQRFQVDDETSSVQTLVFLVNLSLEGRIGDEADDMLISVIEFAKQHLHWPETVRWVCALVHFHCQDVLTIAQLAEEDALEVPAAMANFAEREDVALAACVMMEHFTCCSVPAPALNATRIAILRFAQNTVLCRAAITAAANATTFWGGTSDPNPACEAFVGPEGMGPNAVIAVLKSTLTSAADTALCLRLLCNLCASHRDIPRIEVTRPPTVAAVLDAMDAHTGNDDVACAALSYIAHGANFATMQVPRGLELVLTLLGVAMQRAKGGDRRLLTDVIHTLGCLSTHWKDSKAKMWNGGVVGMLLEILKSYLDEPMLIQQTCNLLSFMCFDSEAITANVTKSGGVALVLAAMRKYRENQPLLTASCAAVSGLTFNNAAGQAVIRDEDAVPLLLDVLRTATRPRLVEMSCLALGTLCWNVDLKTAIAEGDGIKLVVNALEKHADASGVVKNACRALAQIAFNHEKYRDDMTKIGAIRLIIAGMLKHPQHDRAQLHACAALSYLSWTSATNAADILQHDGYRAIIAAMTNNLPNHEVQEHACRALANISGASTTETDLALQHIVEAMVRHDRIPEVQEEACRAIVTLALAHPENKTKLFEKRVGDAVVYALKRFPHAQLVQQEAANAIAHLAYEHQALNQLITDLDGVSALINAMKTFPANAKLQTNACAGLSALAFNNQGAQKQVYDMDGVPCILRAMRDFDKVRIQELGCSLLGTLAWNPKIKERVAEECVPTIIATMRNHTSSGLLQKATIRATAQFAFDSEKNRMLLFEAGGVPLIVNALRDHMDNSKLVSHALVALTYLCWENTLIAAAIMEAGALDIVDGVLDVHSSNDRVVSRAQHLRKILLRRSGSPAGDAPSPLAPASPLAPPSRKHSFRVTEGEGTSPRRRRQTLDCDLPTPADSPVAERAPPFPRSGGSPTAAGGPRGGGYGGNAWARGAPRGSGGDRGGRGGDRDGGRGGRGRDDRGGGRGGDRRRGNDDRRGGRGGGRGDGERGGRGGRGEGRGGGRGGHAK